MLILLGLANKVFTDNCQPTIFLWVNAITRIFIFICFMCAIFNLFLNLLLFKKNYSLTVIFNTNCAHHAPRHLVCFSLEHMLKKKKTTKYTPKKPKHVTCVTRDSNCLVDQHFFRELALTQPFKIENVNLIKHYEYNNSNDSKSNQLIFPYWYHIRLMQITFLLQCASSLINQIKIKKNFNHNNRINQ